LSKSTKEHRKRGGPLRVLGLGLPHLLQEQRPVGQARQRVVERLVSQLVFEGASVAHVPCCQHDARDRWVLQQVVAGRLDEQPRTGAVAHPDAYWDRLDCCALADQRQVVGEGPDVFGVNEVAHAAPDQRCRWQTQNPAHRGGLVADAPLVVDDRDDV
jgi:hypothetical protein